jgi:hypothetical protein
MRGRAAVAKGQDFVTAGGGFASGALSNAAQ